MKNNLFRWVGAVLALLVLAGCRPSEDKVRAAADDLVEVGWKAHHASYDAKFAREALLDAEEPGEAALLTMEYERAEAQNQELAAQHAEARERFRAMTAGREGNLKKYRLAIEAWQAAQAEAEAYEEWNNLDRLRRMIFPDVMREFAPD